MRGRWDRPQLVPLPISRCVSAWLTLSLHLLPPSSSTARKKRDPRLRKWERMGGMERLGTKPEARRTHPPGGLVPRTLSPPRHQPPHPPSPHNSGVNIKTRKRNIAVALDPASFADAVVAVFADARVDGDADGEAWLAAGLPALQATDLDFSRYGDTLFEVLFAGGRMSAGGAVVDDGRATLDRAYLAPGVPEESIGAFVAGFQALLR